MQKRVIIIAGPTAVGKTALSIKMALHFKTAILSADSRQCYQELGIGVAKPSEAELLAVPHYFINSHSIHEGLTAADFETYALQQLEQLFVQHDDVVVVGGTGLYIKALVEGLDAIPAIPQEVKEKVGLSFAEGGITWLQNELRNNDPVFYATGEMHNPQRMLRALEVKLATGKSIEAFKTHQKKERPFQILSFGLELPRAVLYEQINQRVVQMVAGGLVNEAEALLPHRALNALQTVGYRELFDYFDGFTSVERAIELIQQNTRHYAKRQMTWFKNNPNMNWIDATNKEKAFEDIMDKAI
jgi:tRNA dimethylallyltransferase